MKDKLTRIIFSFGIVKMLLHFLSNTNYGLHRDEFLYFDEAKNLGWGYMEVPPLTPFIGKIADLLGGSVFAIRLFPALAGATIIVLSGLLVKEFGGKLWAIVFTCLALLLSPSLLWTNTLFQPVSFNQFFWFLSAFFLVKIIKSKNNKYWYFLGISVGLGLLTKYSIVFYLIGIIIAFLISKHRKLLTTRHPYIAVGIALIIASPNLIWQLNHNLPVVSHMETLSQSQLIHVNWISYLSDQLLFQFAMTVIWLAGLIGLFSISKYKSYRFLAVGLLLTVMLIGLLNGKSYYTIGAYLILFPFGGLVLEKVINKNWIRYALLVFLISLTSFSLPYSLPVFKMDRMLSYCAFMSKNMGLLSPLRWEDGKYYDLPQDMADMNGWEEMVEKVAKIYHSLPAEKKDSCMIYGGGYAHAGAINYYRKKYDLPRANSFNSSYIIWNPNTSYFTNQIMIDDRKQTEPSSWFHSMTLMDSIQNPYAREAGYIYYRGNPKTDISKKWADLVREQKSAFNFD